MDGFARTLEEDPENRDLLWLGTEFGLYYSLDRGQSWEPWTHGFPGSTMYEGENEPYGATVTLAAHVPDSLARKGGGARAAAEGAREPGGAAGESGEAAADTAA